MCELGTLASGEETNGDSLHAMFTCQGDLYCLYSDVTHVGTITCHPGYTHAAQTNIQHLERSRIVSKRLLGPGHMYNVLDVSLQNLLHPFLRVTGIPSSCIGKLVGYRLLHASHHVPKIMSVLSTLEI